MTCDRCPYSLLCLGDQLAHYQCSSCDCIILRFPPTPLLKEFNYSLIHCVSPKSKLIKTTNTIFCPKCSNVDNDIFRYVIVEDLSEL